MQGFEWVDVTTVESASAQLANSTGAASTVAKAGGMDLLDLMKEGIVRPTRVVNLRTLTDLPGIEYDNRRGLTLGALITLAQIAKDPLLTERYRALAEAADHAATPQVRNAATIGGNLLQRPRCWYLRNERFHDQSTAQPTPSNGEYQYHAIFDNAASAIVHASTPATALLAYEAIVHLKGQRGQRAVPLASFLLPPKMDRDRDAAIERDEILTHITLPTADDEMRCAYHKQTERDSYDWPICDVAVVLRMDGSRVANARIAMGWVAPVPRRATASEELLVGKQLDASIVAQAARLAVTGATPLPSNVYKVPVLETVVRRTLLKAAQA
jgi:xanthine dehydrogenase YagS FAD-binding subunit